MALTGRYFEVKDGAVVGGSKARSQLKHPKTSISENTSDAELIALGFYPEDRTGFEPFNGATQTRSGPVNTFEADRVVSAYTVTNKTEQEMDSEKTEEAASTLDQLPFKALLVGIAKAQEDKRGYITTDKADLKAVRDAALSFYKANRNAG